MNLKTQGYFSDCASDEWVWLTRILTDVQHIVDTAVSIAQGALVGGGAAILGSGLFCEYQGFNRCCVSVSHVVLIRGGRRVITTIVHVQLAGLLERENGIRN